MYKLILITLLLCYQLSYSNEKGIVSKIIDGDTIYLKTNQKEIKVRLQFIDAPELNQSFGKESKLFLESLILNRLVIVKGNKKDKYKRILGVISLDEVDINLEMIKAGAAWHFKKYAEFDQTEYQYQIYDEYEQQAKFRELGLWKENAIPPWLWRKNKK